MATYAGAEDLISVGAYVKGSNPEIDEAIEKHADIERFLIQRIEEKAPLEETLRLAGQIVGIEIPEEEMPQPRQEREGVAAEMPQPRQERERAAAETPQGLEGRVENAAVPVQA
jgi:flagellum-specific ATP synthase